MAKITLDAGHGGSDPGCSGNGLVEKNVVLTVTKACQGELIRHGVQVQMTRTSDTSVGLSDRTNMSNNWGADYFVSIHANAGGGDRGEVIVSKYKGKGLELANYISQEMKNAGQSYVKIYDRIGDDGRDYYHTIRETAMDSVIVECAFLDNSTDVEIINSESKQIAFGKAIAKGILTQLGILYVPEVQAQFKRNIAIYNDNSFPDRVCAEFFAMVLNHTDQDCLAIPLSDWNAGKYTTWSAYAFGGSLKDLKNIKTCIYGENRNATAYAVYDYLRAR